MENHAQQLFADARSQLDHAPGAGVRVIRYRWARFQWLRDELKLARDGGHTPRAIARFGYRLLKQAARTARRRAGSWRRRLLKGRLADG